LADSSLRGGAIVGEPGATVAIYRSTFDGNSSANGGAIAVYSDLTVIDSTFTNNTATGTGGEFGGGGQGGAIEAVGMASDTFCGVTITGNTAGDHGGGVVRISTDNTGSDHWSLSNIVGNHADASDGGGMYVQGIAIDLRRVVVANNTAGYVGGIHYVGAGPFVADTIVVADNRATNGIGAGLSIGNVPGTISFSTIVANHAMCSTCWSAAINGGGQTLTASVIADNVSDAPNSPISCSSALSDGGNDFQWPVLEAGGGTDDPTALCAQNVQVVDPLIGALAERTGPAGTFYAATPMPASPVIGTVASCPATDLLGNPRPQPCSAGAIEP
jgi:predicted outer membrane repeat protein